MSRLVIFDCDGVLIDSEPIACRVMAGVLTEIGFPLDEMDLRPFIGRAGPETYAELESRFGKKLPDDIRQRMHAAFRLRLTDGMPQIRGVVDVIEALATPSCVASNSSHDYLRMTLGTAGLFETFAGRIFSSHDVERPKPHPDLFLHAATRMAATPEACIVVEDSVHGVSAGAAAGMRVVGFTGGGHCETGHGDGLIAVGAETVCASMDEVALYLADHGYLR